MSTNARLVGELVSKLSQIEQNPLKLGKLIATTLPYIKNKNIQNPTICHVKRETTKTFIAFY